MSGTEPAFKLPNPKLNPEPNTISYHKLYKYFFPQNFIINPPIATVQAMTYVGPTCSSTSKVHYQCLVSYFLGIIINKNIGGILGASLMWVMFFDYSHDSFFGWNGQGGDVLKMYTSNSTYDMAYNREFQRMCYLVQGEEESLASNVVPKNVLASLGSNETVTASKFVHKKSPHFKYF